MVIIFSGCAQTPIPSSYGVTTQYNMQSVYHWDVLARDVAEQIKIGISTNKLTDRPVFVQQTAETPFGEGFRNMLVTRLVNKGVKTLVQKRDDALLVNYEVQVVHHKKPPVPYYAPVTIAYLTAAVAVVRDVFIHRDTGRGLLAASGAVLGLAALNESMGGSIFSGGPPNTEIIITTSMVQGGEFLFRKTDCYYVNTPDSWLYTVSKVKNIKVTD
jgi:hypothetical protein